MNFDRLVTKSSEEQRNLELKVSNIYERAAETEGTIDLDRSKHVQFLQKGLRGLPEGFLALEASRPWILYWIVHSLALLEAPLGKGTTVQGVVDFLQASEHRDGGFGGSPGQIGHLANTYAGVAAAVTMGDEALRCINRDLMDSFLKARCIPPELGGGFEVCEGGEVDVRGCYTALAIAHMLHLDKHALAAKAGVIDYVTRCQTYEGGLGGEPGNEAHGGYTYCGLAALMLIGKADALNLPSLLHFAVKCQGTVEGGFMGRTNKLVDGCYSFWQGSLFPLLQRLGPEYLSQAGIPASLQSSPPKGNDAYSSEPMVVPSLAESVGRHTLEQQAEQAVLRCKALHRERLKHLERLQQSSKQGAGHRQVPSIAERMAEAACSRAEDALTLAEQRPNILENRASSSILDGCDADADADAEGSAEAPRLYDAEALQCWLLACCQAQNGGMRDKPGVGPDFYHTCYCLSGLSSAQHFGGLQPPWSTGRKLPLADPLCNVVAEKLDAALEYYAPTAVGHQDP